MCARHDTVNDTAFQSRVPFAEAAQKIFIYSANKQFEGYITAKSVTDIYYLTHRLTHNDAETRKILSKLFTLFHLLDTTSLDCRKAVSSEIGDYEDAIMAVSYTHLYGNHRLQHGKPGSCGRAYR